MTAKTRDDDVGGTGAVATEDDERRRHRRSATKIKATVRTRQTEQLVTIENASEQGLGLADIEVVDVGDNVIVALDDGRSVKGKAVWREGDRGGIEFCEPLDIGESLDSDRS